MADVQLPDAAVSPTGSEFIWSVVALLEQLTANELLLAIICVLPLLLVLKSLSAWLSGRDREPKPNENEVKDEIWRATAAISPRVALLEKRAEASARLLERAAATDRAAFDAVHHDLAGIAWELMKLRSELGAEDTRATWAPAPYPAAPADGGSTRNQSALMRARAAQTRFAPTRAPKAAHLETRSTAELNGERAPPLPPSRWVEEIADATVSKSWAALLPGGAPDGDHGGAFVEGPSGKLFAGRSLWGMRPAEEPRRSAIRLVELRPFDAIILLTIAANCATMAWESPLDEMLHPEGTWKSDFVDVCEKLYLSIFTVELLTKVLAYGFVWHPEAYLRDAWCQLDFVVVTLAWAPIFFPSMGNYSVVRSFRALRPLRALKRMPGMPKLVGCVLAALPKLSNVAMLSSFMFLVFGIAGVSFFKGHFHYRCAFSDTLEDSGEFCSMEGPDTCAAFAEGATCAYFAANPSDGPMSFDNIGSASIVIMQCASFDAWTQGMYVLMRHVFGLVWAYYLVVVCIGGFFVVNLFLAILLEEFLQAKQMEDTLNEAKDMEDRRDRDSAERVSEASEAGSTGFGVPVGTGFGLPVGGPPTAEISGLGQVVTADWFNHASTALVIINLVVMCCPYAGMSAEYAANLESIGTVITVIFMVEMALKLLGLGCAGYWRDNWNRLDGTIVLISAVDLGMTVAFASGGPNISFLRILRMLRVLRMLRLMKSWKGLYRVCMTMAKALPQCTNMLVLFALLDLIFALLGMELFGGSFGSYVTPPDDLPRTHFDYIGPSMLTTFIIMSGSWFDIMMAQEAVTPGSSWFFVAVLVIGTYLLLNIFITILLEQFGPVEEDEEEAAPAQVDTEPADVGVEPGDEPLEELDINDRSMGYFRRDSCQRQFCTWVVASPKFDGFIIGLILSSSVCLAIDSPRLDGDSAQAIYLLGLNRFFTAAFTCEMLIKMVSFGVCCGRGTRVLGSELGANGQPKVVRIPPYFRDPWNVLDFFIVIVSLLCLLAEGIPALQPLKSLRALRVLRPLRLLARDPGMRLIITALFKVMPSVTEVFGVLLAVMVVFAILGIQLYSDTFGSCSDDSYPTRESCLAAAAAAGAEGPWLPPDSFDLGSRRALKGGHGDDVGDTDFANSTSTTAPWLNPGFGSFDSFGSAMLLLYIMSTGDGWEDVMYQAMDAVGAGVAPQRNDFSPSALFFIAWMFFGAFFALNLFVGTSACSKRPPGQCPSSVPAPMGGLELPRGHAAPQPVATGTICDNFSRIKAETDGSATLTAGQAQWVESLRLRKTAKPFRMPRPPNSKARAHLFDFVMSRQFEVFIMGVIIANVLLMASDFWRIEQSSFVTVYTHGMIVFSYIYYAEATLKITALGLNYFRDNWCRFDFFLVCTTLLDQFGHELLEAVLPLPLMLLRMLRVLRILRVLRLLKDKRFKGLKDLLMTLVLSAPALVNVVSLLGLLIFMYAVLGVQLFTYVGRGEMLTEDRNFESFGNALLLLFQALTGDDWAAMMNACGATPLDSDCVAEPTAEAPQGTCGSPYAAIPFFVSFQFLGSFVFLNLIVAVILENFTSLGNVDPSLVSAEDIANFKEAWAAFDPDANSWMPVEQLPVLLLSIPPPMGLKAAAKAASAVEELRAKARAVSHCAKLAVPEHDGEVKFDEVVLALINFSFHLSDELQPDLDNGPTEVKRLLEGSEPSTRVLARQPSKLMQGMVAMVIQRQYRKKQEKKQSARTKAPQPTSSR